MVSVFMKIKELTTHFVNIGVQMLYQGTFRQRGVSVGGVFFGYFLDKQKVTRNQMVLAPFTTYDLKLIT
jgi:hypothetical protein